MPIGQAIIEIIFIVLPAFCLSKVERRSVVPGVLLQDVPQGEIAWIATTRAGTSGEGCREREWLAL